MLIDTSGSIECFCRVNFLISPNSLALEYEGGLDSMTTKRRIPLIVGHRANSIHKIKKYLSLGIYALEVDVVEDEITKELVIHHVQEEEFLRHTHSILTNIVEWLTSAIPIIRPPRLRTVLKLISGRANVILDLKWRGMVKKVAEVLKEVSFKGIVYITSKYHRELTEIKRLVPHVKTLASFDDQPLNCAEYLTRIKADGASIRVAFVDKSLVDELHKYGFIIAVWTVNDYEIAKYLIDLGVDMIITDVPEYLLKKFRSEEQVKESSGISIEGRTTPLVVRSTVLNYVLEVLRRS